MIQNKTTKATEQQLTGRDQGPSTMFSSIAKAWSEVSDEGNNKVKFAESSREQSKKENGHYIHYDKSKNSLDRLKKPDTRKGSPRILKPSSENKQNSLLSSALKNLTKAFKKDDGELGEMKSYINGMIKKPTSGAETRSKRSKTMNIEDFDISGMQERSSRRRRRTDTLNYEADDFEKSMSSDRYKKRHYDTALDIPKYESKFEPKKYEIDIPKYESSYDSMKNDIDVPKYESKYTDKRTNGHPKYESQYKSNYSSSLKEHSHDALSNHSWRTEKKPSTSGSKKNIQFEKLTALDLPSSPIFYKNSPLKDEINKANETGESHMDKSAIDSSRIEELCKKVEQLESTVDSLRDELRLANEKSIQSNESILKSQDQSDEVEHFKFGDDRDISRPLSPVKVDLDRFKFIR